MLKSGLIVSSSLQSGALAPPEIVGHVPACARLGAPLMTQNARSVAAARPAKPPAEERNLEFTMTRFLPDRDRLSMSHRHSVWMRCTHALKSNRRAKSGRRGNSMGVR